MHLMRPHPVCCAEHGANPYNFLVCRLPASACAFLIAMALVCASQASSAQCLKRADGKPRKPRPEPITVSTRLLMAHAQTRVTPIFPLDAYRAKVDGSVIVALEIDHNGAVTQTVPLSGPKMLYPAAEAALQQWHFESFCMHGVPYTVRSAVEFQFRWRGDGSRAIPE